MRVGLGFLGAFVASAIGGNALTPTYGNAHIAPRVLLLHTLTMALPVASPPSRCTCWRAAGRPGSPSTRSASWPRGLAWVTGVGGVPHLHGLGRRRVAVDAYRAIVDKRDQRAFLDRPIADDALGRILQAGRMTGSSKNVEPNRFVVVRDRALLEALAATSSFARCIARAAVTIVLVQTREHAFDAGRCAQNMMLAAWNDGIGSCPAHLPEAEVARLLGIPPDIVVGRVIGFGYVDPERASPPPSVARRRLSLTELMHRDRW